MKSHKLFWGSSYDRGLDVLLYFWGDLKKKVPDAELHICYGWDLYDIAAAGNPERIQWKAAVEGMMQQDGIHHHGRVGKKELQMFRQQCGIWAYPTYFQEINCITALECQNDGLVPVTMNLAALAETAKHGILIDGDIKDLAVVQNYFNELIALMDDKDRWKRMSHKCEKFARKFDWYTIAQRWIEEFEKPPLYPTKVTVYTPTVREGFWNVMAENLSKQTHKNFEWVIVDDYVENRQEIADKYAKKYGLDIKYLRGKERKTKRTYSLCNANNTALQAAKGELFVFLQDFVLIQPTALEELVRESARHPGDFIAPVDVYYAPKKEPDLTNKEDWFNGDTDVTGKFMRANVRLQNKGLRRAETITDFEQNFGAVPTATLRVLGGYYEFFDEALGWDDTEIIYRAKKMGYNLWIDEWNIATCIDHHAALGKDEAGTSVNRTRRLNDPRFVWMQQQLTAGNLPYSRRQDIDDKIELLYTIPEDVPDADAVKWMRENLIDIVEGWSDYTDK